MKITVDIAAKPTPFPHYWEQCVGSCHAAMGLRSDWQEQLKMAKQELGFQYIRFHGLLNDDMSVCFRNMFSKEKTYSFHNVDLLFDFLLGIGIKPFIELGFMPTALASGPETCFHYKGNITPPASYDEWQELIHIFTQHLADRYGLDEIRTWFFEVWNEPNLKYFWKGDKAEYMKLYRSAVLGVKAVDKELRVGGPATSVNAWIPDLIAYCKETDTPLDFISTHHYPSDDPLWAEGGMNFDFDPKTVDPKKIEEMFAQIQNRKYDRGVLTEMATKARSQAGDLPLYYTEWNTAVMHDEPYASAFVAKTLADNQGLVEGYSYWTFSDLFEEAGQPSLPFHDGFGMMTIHGVAKPVYRLFQLYHDLGEERLPVTAQPHPTAELLAVRNGGNLTLVAYNQNTPSGEIEAAEMNISLKNTDAKHGKIMRIDQDNANAKQAWLDMGSPVYPTKEQLDLLHKASETHWQDIVIENGEIGIHIPPHGLAAIKIEGV